MKSRYLMFFSYIGTTFRSSEKIWLKEGRNYPDLGSIQGTMEIALSKLRPLNYPNVTLSSRTDGGVHALNATAHVDLERSSSYVLEPNYINFELNCFFNKNSIPINLRKCIQVNDSFSARFNAVQRTYLYRFAVFKKGFVEPGEKSGIGSFIPIEEWKRCYFYRLSDNYSEFDIEKFKEAAKYFVGYHDFTTFKKFDKSKDIKSNRREIYSIDVRPGSPLVTSYRTEQDNAFDYWEIEIKGRAFVHNQIRRMIGTLISVAIGKLPPKEVQVMLQIPSKHSWHSFIRTCPPEGLYLCNVDYNPEDLIYNPDGNTVSSELSEDSDSV